MISPPTTLQAGSDKPPNKWEMTLDWLVFKQFQSRVISLNSWYLTSLVTSLSIGWMLPFHCLLWNPFWSFCFDYYHHLLFQYEAFLLQNISYKFLGFIICSFLFYELRFYLYIGITLSVYNILPPPWFCKTEYCIKCIIFFYALCRFRWYCTKLYWLSQNDLIWWLC